MANYKVVDANRLDADMATVADAIRSKAGTEDALSFPDGFVSAVEGIEAGEEAFFTPDSGIMYFKKMHIPDAFSKLDGYSKAYYLEEFYAPNAALNQPNSVAPGAFQFCTALRIIYLPKATYFMHYNFRSCTSLKEAQLGSAGYPVTNMANYTFSGVAQADLTITVYVNAEKLADIPTAVASIAPWGATNATIIYRNSTTGEVITE